MMSKSMKSAVEHDDIDQAAPPKPSRKEIPSRQALYKQMSTMKPIEHPGEHDGIEPADPPKQVNVVRSMKSAGAHNDISGQTLQADVGNPFKKGGLPSSRQAQVRMMSKTMKSAGEHDDIDQADPPKPSRMQPGNTEQAGPTSR